MRPYEKYHKNKVRKTHEIPFLLNIPATILIILLNIAIFFYFTRLGGDKVVLDDLILSPANLFLKNNLYCLVTSGFVHENLKHLFFNMLGVFIFGSIVEKRFGSMKMLFIYFGALFSSMFLSIFIYFFILNKAVALIGASGAVMGLIAVSMLVEPFTVTYETFFPVPVIIKGWMFLLADIKGFLGGEIDGVSHLSHLIGFISIAFIVYFFDKDDKAVFKKGLVVNIISFLFFLAFMKYL